MEQCYFACHACGERFPMGKESLCPKCGGILTVEYEEAYLKEAGEDLKKQKKESMWDYRKVLPPVRDENVVTFQEGCTKLKKSRVLGKELGIEGLFFKDETVNPTGSFKDRSVSVCVSMAKEFQCPGIVVSSSGNGGAATGAYGTKGDIDTIIFVPETTPVGKVAQAIAYGGKVIKVRGNFSRSYQAAVQMADEKGYMNVTTTFLSPFGLEGYKIIGYEIYEQMGKAPDYIVIPVGAGPVLYGIYKSFEEMKTMGYVDKLPRLVCVQAKGCAPISQAWQENRKVVGCKNPKSVASAISDPLLGYEQDGDITVEAIRKTDGYGLTAEDDKILEAGRILAQKEGLFVEPSSAATVAGVKQLIQEGILTKDDTCVCLLTGHGLKDSSAYIPEGMEIPVIDTIKDLN
jgi:threonine synthase